MTTASQVPEEQGSPFPQEPRLTDAEWSEVQKLRGVEKKRSFSLSKLFPKKLSESGAQAFYIGVFTQILGVVVATLSALEQIDLAPADLIYVTPALNGVGTALMANGSVHRYKREGQRAAADAATFQEDLGTLPDEDDFGPVRD